jgi:predicted small integral membrane protein
MTLRLSKSLLILAVAFFYTLVVFDNTTDYNSNFQFVVHVLKMDTTFPGNHGMWRSTSSPAIDTAFYLSIILWEAITCALCWWSGISMLRTIHLSASHFARAKAIGIVALTLGMLMWFVAFLCIGGEWFLMWQSKIWNGQEAAFRMFVVLGLLLLYLTAPEPEDSSLITK